MTTRLSTAGWLQERGGQASFADFMAAALYDPEGGYYSKKISSVGRQGDFSTSATLHPILGAALANWIQQQWQEMGSLPVIEIGAGDGSLGKSIFTSLPWWKRWKLDYHIVDISAPLVALQKTKLKGRKVRWHTGMKDALGATGGKALIISNELVDAFPCRLLQKSDLGWDEIFLRLSSGKKDIEEELRVLSPEHRLNWSACADALDFKSGQRVEVQDSYQDWLASWFPWWQAGTMLTIDYGAEAEALYWRKPRGSLRAYFSQMRFEGPDLYARMGQQDLTLDVNFTDLKNWGESLGLKTLGYFSQRAFVQNHASAILEKSTRDPAVAFLQSPDGAGEAFRVLVQGK